MKTTFNSNKSTAHFCNLSWHAIIAGIIAALSIQTLFNLFGLAVGLSAFTPEIDTAARISGGSIIWLALTGAISMFIGGWIAGQSVVSHVNGALHGFITWGATTLIVFVFAATAAGAVLTTGAISVLNKDLTYQMSQIKKQQMPMLANQMANQNASTSSSSMLSTQPIPVQNQEQIKQAAKETASILAGVAFASFIMFLLSAIAGAAGGWYGIKYRVSNVMPDENNPTMEA